MSYEEARQDRRRKRRNENLSLILGLLQGVGGQIMAQKRATADRKYGEERDALKFAREQELAKQAQEAAMERERMRAENDLQVASMRGSGQTPLGILEAMGAEGEDQDPDIAALNKAMGEIDPYSADPSVGQSMQHKLKLARVRRGMNGERWLAPQRGAGQLPNGGMRMDIDESQRGNPDPSQPVQRTGDMTMGAAAGAQQSVGEREYAKLPLLYRRARAGDQSAWMQLSTLFPELGGASPYMGQSPMQPPSFMSQQPTGQ